MKSSLKKGLRLSPIFASILLTAFNAHAMPANNTITGDNIRAIAPYRIKPNTPSFLPSGFSPAQIIKAYTINSIPNQGAGQTIAIVDAYDDPNAEADLGVFSTTFGLPACTTANGCFKKVYGSGTQPTGDTGWGVEISLDVQWVHAIAPLAKIILVEAASNSFTDLFQAINVAVQNGASVVSMSWGGGEFSGETSYDSTFNVPNVTFTASTGDNGTGILYPAISPNVIGCGGTTLTLDSSGNYSSETAWSGSGGGISAYEPEPSYQSGLPIPNNPNKLRGVPDVSYNADPNTGVSVYDSYGQNGWMVIGGTSAAAPQWAALIAIAKASATSSLTNINSTLYTLAKSNYSGLYHDVTSGSNGSCGTNCTAQVGYDYVTGIGSPKAAALVQALTGSGGGGGNRIPI